MKSVLFISCDCWKDQIKLYIGKCLKTSKFYIVLKIPTLGRQWSLLSFRKSRIRWLLTWSLSHVQLFATLWTIQSMEFSRSEYWVGSLFLLQGIFPTQGLNPGLLHWRQILYQLSHQGSPRILEWVAIPGIEPGSPALQANSLQTDLSVQFSSVQSLSRVQLFATPWTAACQASLSITNWAIREADSYP